MLWNESHRASDAKRQRTAKLIRKHRRRELRERTENDRVEMLSVVEHERHAAIGDATAIILLQLHRKAAQVPHTDPPQTGNRRFKLKHRPARRCRTRRRRQLRIIDLCRKVLSKHDRIANRRNRRAKLDSTCRS